MVNDSLSNDTVANQKEKYQPFFNNFIISAGIGKYWNYDIFNGWKNYGKLSYIGNISFEFFLSSNQRWAIEETFFYWKFPIYVTNTRSRYILSTIFRYYFKFFGDYFYPSIHCGGFPISLPVLSWDIGINFDLQVYKSCFIRLSFRLMETGGDFAGGNNSEINYLVSNLNLRYQINY